MDEPIRALPPVNELLEHPIVRSLIEERGRERVLGWTREEIDAVRRRLAHDQATSTLPKDRLELTDLLAERVALHAQSVERTALGRVINATGVVLHTGLGRAPLSQAAVASATECAAAANLEIDLESGERRQRGYQLESAWKTLTTADESLVVNNNAAATLLTLQALCAGREVIISRGQLIEIGGSFRLPEIFALSGAVLKEVGTTNRTRLADYERAIGPDTAAVMHVHTSNYRVVGFSAAPEIGELAELAHRHELLAIDDIGSGALVDVSQFGLPAEPTFQGSLSRGADVVLGSGDKLLGGPQCGIILGRAECVERMRSHPLARTLRIDKLTLAALSATLDSYLRKAEAAEIPTIRAIRTTQAQLMQRARKIVDDIGNTNQLQIEICEDTVPVGGGSLPLAQLSTAAIALVHSSLSAEELVRQLRLGSIRLVGRIQRNQVLIDLRSVQPEDDSKITLALRLADRQGFDEQAKNG